jgi:hypothetical protein
MADDTPEDERIPVDLEDDETVQDPVDEPEEASDDEPEGADEPEGEQPLAAEPPAPKGDRSIGRLREERRTLAEENARLTRQLDEMRRAPPAPVETPQQRADRLALLAPEDRIREEFREELRARDQQQQNFSRQIMDNTDRAAFAAKVASNPLARKLEAEVERKLADMRRNGADAPRETIFTYLVGERALQQMGKGSKTAAANRQRQQARPASSRGDVRVDRRRGAETAEDIEARFGDVPI